MRITKKLVKFLLSFFLMPARPGNILVIHIGRCGSTVLGKMLNQHSMIYWASELYEPIFGSWRDQNNGIETIGKMPKDAIQILKNNYWQALHRYYGFEIKPYHFNLIRYKPEYFIEQIEQLGFSHFIILDRKNRLRKIVSSDIAHKHGGYHVQSDHSRIRKSTNLNIENVRIDFDSKPLQQFLNDYDSQLAQIEKILVGKKVLRLTYEDDISENPMVAYKKACEFLKLPTQNVTVSLKKTNPGELSSLIENFEEVSQSLKGTAHEWMLELESKKK